MLGVGANLPQEYNQNAARLPNVEEVRLCEALIGLPGAL
jgi:hypothetical protein